MSGKLPTTPYKGVRDFYPSDWEIEQYIFDTWRAVLENFGYEEYSASVLESAELYEAKSSEEIVNEQTYTFTDRGDRKVTLRPEMTPTVARMIAGKAKSMNFPARWYSIPNLFRYERPQKGRLREHFQLNVDLFGVAGLDAEIEILTIVSTLLKKFGVKESQFVIKINDRAHLTTLFRELGLTTDQSRELFALLDRKNKIPDFDAQVETLLGKPLDLSDAESPKVKELIATLQKLGIDNVVFDPSIVRGFDYYTGIVFEVFDTSGENSRALFGGGRYDGIMDIFGIDPIPTVGFGMGDVTMRDVLETYNLLPAPEQPIDVYICTFSRDFRTDARTLAMELRNKNIRTVIDYSDKRIGDQIQNGDKKNARFVVCIGEDEIARGTFTVKDLASGNEQTVSRADLANVVR